ncbi:MAG: aminopeptidase P N-terminal domain-containing protein [Chloroflexi bacterium]|nr:aminopeptidase P N-terminal domain-containing protein [Chloroflexota bacterium]MDA1146050.1 aminopeptidase P N-terminal domain-containing protein [Chloroflexota bacterium]
MFAERRAELMESMRAHADNTAAIFVSARELIRNSDVYFEFRQDSTFFYLTGFDEPDSVALLRPGAEAPFILFVRPHDPETAIWVGARSGVDGAIAQHGADEAYPIEELAERLPKLLAEAETLYYPLGVDDEVDALVSKHVARRREGSQRGATPLASLRDPSPIVDEMRLHKSEPEAAALNRAVTLTGHGFDLAMRATRPGMHEYEVQALMEAEFRRLGSRRNGYPSIVAGAHDSCILHYTTNRKELREGDLLLIDAGAEWDYYTADVTRTWPVSGKFTPEQRAVYDVVLRAQRAGIAAAQPGAPLDGVHKAALRAVVEGLVELGILEGDIDTLIDDEAYRPFFMHGTSHWLGMDVHDVGRYRDGTESVALRPGMCFTVEPGIYIAPDNQDVPVQYRGIGIRIEDDILITADGHTNLSGHIPSDPDEIEAIIGSATR